MKVLEAASLKEHKGSIKRVSAFQEVREKQRPAHTLEILYLIGIVLVAIIGNGETTGHGT